MITAYAGTRSSNVLHLFESEHWTLCGLRAIQSPRPHRASTDKARLCRNCERRQS